MKRLIAALFLSLLVSAPAVAEEARLMLNLTSDDEHRSLMALHVAEKVLKNGHPVDVFLNVNGVNVAYGKPVPGQETAPAVLKRLIDGGARVWLCPHCVHHENRDEQRPMAGINLLPENQLTPMLMNPDARVVSY